jgi:hypothetical protein
MNIMSIFEDARPEMAFLKLGIYGEAGTGKTFTSTKVAIGLHDLIKSGLPVYFFDTETGSDFVREKIKAATGHELKVAKTRAFADLVKGIDEIPPGAIVIIDSITHYWTEIMESYRKKNNLSRLSLNHWIPIKAMWAEFTDRFVNSKLHIILCGRSADKWGDVEDESGIKELKKIGTKMRTEGQMAYEPSLLVEMELIQVSAKLGSELIHRAYVRKDRFDVINGQIFDDPGFESFLPHVQLLNLGGEHRAFDTDRNSQAMFDDPNIGEKRALNKEILCEKIANEIKKLFPAQTEKDKAERIKLMEEVFGTNSWTEISTLFKNDRLAIGLEVIQAKVAEAFAPSTPAVAMTIVNPDKETKPKTKGAKS